MTTGERIRTTRKQADGGKGITQRELGKRCGIAEPTIRRYELNKLNPKIETLRKIADALNVSVDDLLDLRPDEKNILDNSEDHADFTRDQLLEAMVEGRPFRDIEDALSLINSDTLDMVCNLSTDALGNALWSYFGPLNKLGKFEAVRRIAELNRLSEYQK